MKFSRHLRRLKARWRLHRMEWEAMHRPLEPPKGYEHMFTMEAVFPGFRRKWIEMKSFEDYRQAFKRAWQLFRHSYVTDPEMEKLEKSWGLREEKKIEQNVEAMKKKGRDAAENFREAADQIIDEIGSKGPEAQRVLQDRVTVLSNALSEFSKGYRETVDGKFRFWPEAEDEDIDTVKVQQPDATVNSKQSTAEARSSSSIDETESSTTAGK